LESGFGTPLPLIYGIAQDNTTDAASKIIPRTESTR
jgi:hypothetical protein